MAAFFNLLAICCLLAGVLAKRMHFKEDLEAKDKETKSFMNLFNNEEIYATNERYARHAETITESVLDHLIDELKHQYFSKSYNPNSPLRRLIRNLNKEMKRNEHKKMLIEREKKKEANKNKKKGNVSKKNKKTNKENVRH